MATIQSVPNQFFVSIGEILWDVAGNQRYVGGAPFNFSYHAAALGAKAAIISKVSQDDLGADLIRRAQELHVDTRNIQRCEDHPTGTVTAEIRENGSTNYVFPEECAWDFIRFTDQARTLIDFASVINFGTLAQRSPGSRSAIMAALAAARDTVTCFLDLNLRAPFYSREILTPSLRAAHVVKVSESELSELKRIYDLGSDDSDAARSLMRQYDVNTLVLTRGADGASAWDHGDEAHVSGYRIPVVDTIGCGDAFGAAFMLHLKSGSSLIQALESANFVGAFVATQAGGTPNYTRDDLLEFRRENPRANQAASEVIQLPSA